MPPVWLIGFLVAAWRLGGLPGGVDLGWGGNVLGMVCVLAGVGLIVAAVVEFKKAQTTIIPHQVPNALITSGVFAFSRNPIYLADALILAGLILIWSAVYALPLIYVFIRLIERRFISPEEGRLTTIFGDAFTQYCAKTRRWI